MYYERLWRNNSRLWTIKQTVSDQSLQQFIVAAQAAFLLQSQCLVCFSLHYGMKKTRNDRTIAEKLELLDRYKTLSHFSQCEAAERLEIKPRYASFSVLNKYSTIHWCISTPRGCLSCSFRKTGYYSQPLITSKSAGPEVDVLSGFHCGIHLTVYILSWCHEIVSGCLDLNHSQY